MPTSNISEATFRCVAEDKLRSAIESGEFENLPGLGKPSPLIDQPYHPLWWVMRKMQREQFMTGKSVNRQSEHHCKNLE